jgi:predicted GNAT family acetyltransferase
MTQHCDTKNGLKVCAIPTGANGRHRIEVYKRTRLGKEEEIGEMTLDPGSFKGKQILRVSHSQVEPEARRTGAGTAMYEMALDVACKENVLLFSDVTRSNYAEAFWRKQKGKKRASCVLPNADAKFSQNYYPGPLQEQEFEIEEKCYEKESTEKGQAKCVADAMKALKAKLPKESRNAEGHRYWPCGAYAVKKGYCDSDHSLKGLPRKRVRLAGLPEHQARTQKARKGAQKATPKSAPRVQGTRQTQCMQRLRGGILAGACGQVKGSSKRKNRR